MEVVLIAGLGPGLMENEDLLGSLYDPVGIGVARHYLIHGKNYAPDNLVYTGAGIPVPLLRKKKRTVQSDYISENLKSVLDRSGMAYSFVPIKSIWEGKRVDAFHEDAIVCLSTTFMWNEQMLDRAIEWVFENFHCRFLVLGGQYAVLKQEYLLRRWLSPSSILQLGEAELSLAQVIQHFQSGKAMDASCDIPNLLFKLTDGTVVRTRCERYDFRSVPRVRFQGKTSYIPYMSMRGCPYRCKFCALRECTPVWQYYTAERIVRDWKEYARENGATHFSINDSTFFIPYSKIRKLLELLDGTGFTWDANARADTPFDAGSVKLLEKAGCTALFFGFESMSNAILQNIDKRTTVDDNRRINELFKDSSIVTKMSFIVGFPGETPDEFKKTQEYLINEHVGRYSLYVFEYESDILPIGKEKDKYQLELLPDRMKYHWAHSGEHWRHCGMDSDTARELRRETIQKTRTTPGCLAVYRTWQDSYEWPFVPMLGKQDNLAVEKLLDRLVFAPLDSPGDLENYIITLAKELEAHGVVPLADGKTGLVK